MSLLRRQLENLSRTIPTMKKKTKRAQTLNGPQMAKVVRIVRVVAAEVAEGVVEVAAILTNPFARKDAPPPVHGVRRVMKTTRTTMMTIWKWSMSI